MTPQEDSLLTELEQRLSSQKVVNFEAELSFARRKSGVRVSSAPPSDLAIEALNVRELLEVLLDDKAKRRLSLTRKTNDELFSLYNDHLKVNVGAGQMETILKLSFARSKD